MGRSFKLMGPITEIPTLGLSEGKDVPFEGESTLGCIVSGLFPQTCPPVAVTTVEVTFMSWVVVTGSLKEGPEGNPGR